MQIEDVFGAVPKSVWQYLCENGQGLYVPAYQSLSGFLCLRHSMSKRSIYANESKNRHGGQGGIAAHFA